MPQPNQHAVIQAPRTNLLRPAASPRLLLNSHKLNLVVSRHCLSHYTRAQLPRLLALVFLYHSSVVLAVHSLHSLQRCCWFSCERIEVCWLSHYSHHSRCSLSGMRCLHASRIAGMCCNLRGAKGRLQFIFLARRSCLNSCFG